MIKVTIFENSSEVIMRCTFEGHAEYADKGEDIICAAVSILYINTVNAIENFTSDKSKMITKEDSKKNRFDISFKDIPSEQSQLLMNTLLLGLDSIQNQYGSRYLKITHKEVQ